VLMAQELDFNSVYIRITLKRSFVFDAEPGMVLPGRRMVEKDEIVLQDQEGRQMELVCWRFPLEDSCCQRTL